MSDDAQPYTREELEAVEKWLDGNVYPTMKPESFRRLLATAKQGVEAQERLTRAHQSNENRYRRMVEALGNDAYSFNSALEKLIAAAVERGVRKTSGVSFHWTCPRCGAMHYSSVEHCPCETEGGP